MLPFLNFFIYHLQLLNFTIFFFDKNTAICVGHRALSDANWCFLKLKNINLHRMRLYVQNKLLFFWWKTRHGVTFAQGYSTIQHIFICVESPSDAHSFREICTETCSVVPEVDINGVLGLKQINFSILLSFQLVKSIWGSHRSRGETKNILLWLMRELSHCGTWLFKESWAKNSRSQEVTTIPYVVIYKSYHWIIVASIMNEIRSLHHFLQVRNTLLVQVAFPGEVKLLSFHSPWTHHSRPHPSELCYNNHWTTKSSIESNSLPDLLVGINLYGL